MRQNNNECYCESLNDVFALLTASDYMLCKTNLSLTPRARQQPGLSTKLAWEKLKLLIWISNIFYVSDIKFKNTSILVHVWEDENADFNRL